MKTISYIHDYMKKMKHIQELFLEYVDNDDSQEQNLNNLNKYLKDQNVTQNKQELKLTLHLISKITDNHHKSNDYFNKIEKILITYQDDIKKYFTNFDIFNIFKSNKRILLFLFESKLIIPDKSLSWIISNGKFKERKYPQYFFNEFKSFFDEKLVKEIISSTPDISDDNLFTYEQNRKIGENTNLICNLIRKDSVEEFITIYNRTNFSLSSTIEQSIYETNLFLMKNNPTLIEYAAFFGAIQIFKYLFLCNVELKSSLWLYVIHGKNPELIHFLEENNVKPQDNTSNQCFDESIKCHHNDFANYIKDTFYKKEGEDEFKLFSQSLHFYNLIDLVENNYSLSDELKFNMFYELCKYDYIAPVEFLVNDKTIKINSTKILKNLIILMIYQIISFLMIF